MAGVTVSYNIVFHRIIVSMLLGAVVIEVPRRYYFADKQVINIIIKSNWSSDQENQTEFLLMTTDLERVKDLVNCNISAWNTSQLQPIFNNIFKVFLKENAQWIFDNTNKTLAEKMEFILKETKSSLNDRIKFLHDNMSQQQQNTMILISRIQGDLNSSSANEIKTFKTSTDLEDFKESFKLSTEGKYRQLHHKYNILKTELEYANAKSTPIGNTIFLFFIFFRFIYLSI